MAPKLPTALNAYQGALAVHGQTLREIGNFPDDLTDEQFAAAFDDQGEDIPEGPSLGAGAAEVARLVPVTRSTATRENLDSMVKSWAAAAPASGGSSSDLKNPENLTICSACGDVGRKGQILPCSAEKCPVGLCVRAGFYGHGCLELKDLTTNPMQPVPGLRGKDMESSVHSAAHDASPDVIIKIVRAIAHAKSFYCPLCLSRAGQPIPYRITSFSIPRNLPAQRLPLLVFFLYNKSSGTAMLKRLGEQIEAIYITEPYRLLIKVLPMGDKAGRGIRQHNQDSLPFLKRFPNARILIIIEALAMFDTGAIACQGNDHDGWFGSHLPLILDLYLGRDLHRNILLQHQVGAVLLMCGPATTARPAQEEVSSEVRSNRINWVIGFNSLTIVPTMVVSSLLNVLDEIIVSFKSPRDAIGSAASESLFQHTGIVVWDSNSGDQRPWVALQHSKQRPFGAVGPDSCTKCTNSNIDGHFDSNKVKANYRFSCTSCRSSTATDTLLLGQDIVPCTVRRHLYWHPMPGRAVLRDSPGWREPGAHPAKRVKTNR